MTDFQLYTGETASSGAAPVLSDLAEQIGFVPNVFAVLGGNPQALQAFGVMNAKLAACSLTAIEREIVQTAVSAANVCGYCVAGHTAFAQTQGLDTGTIAAVRQDRALESPQHEALRRFARILTENRGRHSGEALGAFLAAGYRKDQVFDVVLAVAVKTFSNLTSSITGIALDDAFAPFAWSPADRHSNAA